MKNKKKLTKQQVKDYLASEGEKCPVCKSNIIESECAPNVDAGGASQEVYCCECNVKWLDSYVLTGVELI